MITSKQIAAKIKTFSTNKAKLQLLGHEIGMMILNHAAPIGAGPNACGTNDCTQAIALIREMPKSWQVQMTEWFKVFSPIRVVVKNDKCEYDPAYKKLATAAEKLDCWKLAEAMERPFYELIEEPEAKVYSFDDLVKMFKQLGTRIASKIDKGEVKADDVADATAIVTLIEKTQINRSTKVKVANDVKPTPTAKPKAKAKGAKPAAAGKAA